MSDLEYDFTSKDGKIRKKIIDVGVKGCRPMERDECSYLMDDSPAENVLTLGEYDSEHSCLLERCLLTMEVKEKSHFWMVDAELVLTLVGFTASQRIHEMSDESKLELALKHKEKGSLLYKEGRIEDALSRFHRSLKLICFAQKTNLYDIVCSNIALCLIKKKRFEHAISVTTKVLTRDPNNVKCFMRRGVAFKNLRDYEKSNEDLKAVLKIEPNNKEASKELAFVNTKLAEMNSRYKNMCQKIFSYS